MRSSGQQRWLVSALMLATFVNFLGLLALGPFLPQIADSLGTTVALVGQIPALVTLLAALLGLVIGPLADHYGYDRTLIAGVLAATLGTLATGLVPTFAILLVVAIFGAVGRAAVQPAAQALVATRFPDERSQRYAQSRVQMGNSGAAIIGVPLLTSIAAFGGWRLAFLALAVVGLISLLILWRTVGIQARPSPARLRFRGVLASYLPLLGEPRTTMVMVASLLGSTGIWMVWGYLAAFLVEVHGFTIQDVGWVYLLGGGGVMIGTMLTGTSLGAYPRTLMIVGRIAGAALLACALIPPLSGLTVVALVSLAMVFQGTWGVPSLMLLNAWSPAGRATTMTLNNSAITLGTALGGTIGGILLATGGYSAIGLCAPIFQLLSAAIIWWLSPRLVPVYSRPPTEAPRAPVSEACARADSA